MAGKNVIDFTADNWQTEVLGSDVPVLVDFWAVWCGPCRSIGPAIEELASEYAGKIKVGKVNIDDEQELATQYRVSSIPLILIFKGGKVVDKTLGAQPKNTFKAMIDRVLGA
jgi:thioredoxin 1